MRLARDVRAFFVCARVREARKQGWEISNFLGFLGIVRVGGARANFSGSEKFLIFFGIFGAKTKFFEFFGKFEFFGFQKGWRSLRILFEM